MRVSPISVTLPPASRAIRGVIPCLRARRTDAPASAPATRATSQRPSTLSVPRVPTSHWGVLPPLVEDRQRRGDKPRRAGRRGARGAGGGGGGGGGAGEGR